MRCLGAMFNQIIVWLPSTITQLLEFCGKKPDQSFVLFCGIVFAFFIFYVLSFNYFLIFLLTHVAKFM
jgi:hypothetical protein